MYFIVSGRYRLAELRIEIMPGQVVGELALLAPTQSRTQTLECIDNGEVLQITYDQVRQLYYQNPNSAFICSSSVGDGCSKTLRGWRANFPNAERQSCRPP
jgi:CRP-like cAMP-binding protein